jgi:hypothetical protein
MSLNSIPSLGKSGTSRLFFARSILHLAPSDFVQSPFYVRTPIRANRPKLTIRFLKTESIDHEGAAFC